MSPFGLGLTTTSEMYGVGPSALSITSSSYIEIYKLSRRGAQIIIIVIVIIIIIIIIITLFKCRMYFALKC